MNVTHDVISDLWPVYAAGEASRDTRTLVETFLAEHQEFARTLRAAATLPHPELATAAAAEVAALKRTRDLVHGRSWLRSLRLIALVFSVLAVGRAMSEIAWTDTSRHAFWEGVAAVVCWSAYLLILRHFRARALKT